MRYMLKNITGSLSAFCLLVAFCLLTLTGCSDGSSGFDPGDGPLASNSSITRVGTPGIGTGETFLFRTHIAFNVAADPANPPMVDVFNPSGQSLIGGKQKLQQVLAPAGQPITDPNAWTYQFTLAPTTVTPTVTAIVYAQDTDAKKGNTPYALSNVALP